MLGDSINFNNFNWNPVVLKKNLLKPLKLAIFGAICAKMGFPWTTPKTKNFFFFEEITKTDHKLSKTIYFLKISYVLAEL